MGQETGYSSLFFSGDGKGGYAVFFFGSIAFGWLVCSHVEVHDYYQGSYFQHFVFSKDLKVGAIHEA